MKNINNSFDLGNFIQLAVEHEYHPHAGTEERQGVKLFLNFDQLRVEKKERIEAEYEKMFEDLTEPPGFAGQPPGRGKFSFHGESESFELPVIREPRIATPDRRNPAARA